MRGEDGATSGRAAEHIIPQQHPEEHISRLPPTEMWLDLNTSGKARCSAPLGVALT